MVIKNIYITLRALLLLCYNDQKQRWQKATENQKEKKIHWRYALF